MTVEQLAGFTSHSDIRNTKQVPNEDLDWGRRGSTGMAPQSVQIAFHGECCAKELVW